MKPYEFNALFGLNTSQLSNILQKGYTSPFSYKSQPLKELNWEITLDKQDKVGNYIVVEGDWYIYSDRFQTGVEADSYARELAEKNPGTDFTVYHRDFTFRGTSQVEVTRR